MSYKKIVLTVFLTAVFIVICCSCQGEPESEKNKTTTVTDKNDSEPIKIVTSISIIADLVEQVVGERGEVDYLVDLGEEPEEYEPTPSDFQAVNDADAFFINGYNLETWIEQIASNVSDTKIVATAEQGSTIPLEGTDIPDPHLWFDPMKVKNIYIEQILETLIEIDPHEKEFYQDRAEHYQQELAELDQELHQAIEEIPEKHRIIISIENCFKYYGETYSLETDGIWELNAHEEGTPQQFARIIDLVNDQQVPALFVASTIDPRYMERVSEETGVDIAGTVYTDALGQEGSGASNYLDMMRHNTQVITEGLTTE